MQIESLGNRWLLSPPVHKTIVSLLLLLPPPCWLPSFGRNIHAATSLALLLVRPSCILKYRDDYSVMCRQVSPPSVSWLHIQCTSQLGQLKGKKKIQPASFTEAAASALSHYILPIQGNQIFDLTSESYPRSSYVLRTSIVSSCNCQFNDGTVYICEGAEKQGVVDFTSIHQSWSPVVSNPHLLDLPCPPPATLDVLITMRERKVGGKKTKVTTKQ